MGRRDSYEWAVKLWSLDKRDASWSLAGAGTTDGSSVRLIRNVDLVTYLL